MNPLEQITLPPELEAQFRAVFEACDAAGKPLYSREQLEDFAVEAILDLLRALPQFELTPQLMRLLERFCERIGLADGPSNQVLEHARDYFKKNPPAAALKAAVSRLLRGHVTQGSSDPSHQRAALAALGLAVNRIVNPPAAEGIRATPLARFSLQEAEKKNET